MTQSVGQMVIGKAMVGVGRASVRGREARENDYSPSLSEYQVRNQTPFSLSLLATSLSA